MFLINILNTKDPIGNKMAVYDHFDYSFKSRKFSWKLFEYGHKDNFPLLMWIRSVSAEFSCCLQMIMILHLSIRKDVNMKKIHMHDFNSGLILFSKDATGLYHQPKKLPNFWFWNV